MKVGMEFIIVKYRMSCCDSTHSCIVRLNRDCSVRYGNRGCSVRYGGHL